MYQTDIENFGLSLDFKIVVIGLYKNELGSYKKPVLMLEKNEDDNSNYLLTKLKLI